MPNQLWGFDGPPNMATIVDRRIIREGRWIAYVTHDSDDGGWQFHTADDDIDNLMVIGLLNMVNRDPTITQLADLPIGWHAWRASPDEPWQRAMKTHPEEN